MDQKKYLVMPRRLISFRQYPEAYHLLFCKGRIRYIETSGPDPCLVFREYLIREDKRKLMAQN